METINFLTEADVVEIAAKVFGELNGQLTKPAYVSVKQFADDYGISRVTIYRHIKEGHLRLAKFGNRAFLNRIEAEKMFVKTKPVPVERLAKAKKQAEGFMKQHAEKKKGGAREA